MCGESMSTLDAGYFPWEDLHEVPDSPGIYAWYLPFRMPGTAVADEEMFSDTITAYSEILKRPDSTIRMKGNLSSMHIGKIEQIAYGTPKHKFSKLLTNTIRDEQSRTLLFDILNGISYSNNGETLNSLPAGLMAPLYIGVAKNLKSRIASHKKGINDFQTQLNAEDMEKEFESMLNNSEQDEDLSANTERRDRIFAQRIAYSLQNSEVYTQGDLIVFCSPIIETNILDIGEQRKIIEAAETLLNRVMFPAYGRR